MGPWDSPSLDAFGPSGRADSLAPLDCGTAHRAAAVARSLPLDPLLEPRRAANSYALMGDVRSLIAPARSPPGFSDRSLSAALGDRRGPELSTAANSLRSKFGRRADHRCQGGERHDLALGRSKVVGLPPSCIAEAATRPGWREEWRCRRSTWAESSPRSPVPARRRDRTRVARIAHPSEDAKTQHAEGRTPATLVDPTKGPVEDGRRARVTPAAAT